MCRRISDCSRNASAEDGVEPRSGTIRFRGSRYICARYVCGGARRDVPVCDWITDVLNSVPHVPSVVHWLCGTGIAGVARTRSVGAASGTRR